MPVSLIAFDLDGTALAAHTSLSHANRRALLAAAARGVELVPASGRMKDFLPEEVTALPGVRYAITANGAGVYHLPTGEAVWRCLIPNEKARQVLAALEEYGLFVEFYTGGSAVTREGDPQRAFTHFAMPSQKATFLNKAYRLVPDLGALLRQTGLEPEKINLPYVPAPLRQEVWRRLEALGGLALTSSLPDNIEVNAQGAHKGAALSVLARRLGVPAAQVMALGDNGNDVTMLEYAGVSVCMGDGSPEAKAAARFVGLPHTQDGLARAIQEFAL